MVIHHSTALLVSRLNRHLLEQQRTVMLQGRQGAAKLPCSHDSRKNDGVWCAVSSSLTGLWSLGSVADPHPAAELETGGWAELLPGKEHDMQANCKLDSDRGFFFGKDFSSSSTGCDSYSNLAAYRRRSSHRYHFLLHR